ncbi:hypothetical protein [Acidisphaera sp. L21]|uniref:hypothetical protein n=1 Tax=Acidisphaera sp. L21 TaxID=1641851 RepID=UPI00131DA50B|nr:hypothetical protein [Acidisphaera sp. L21]
MTRRGFAALAVLGLAASPALGQSRVPEVGPPLGVVTLRISSANDAGFLHDLADYTNHYGFVVAGTPGGPVVDGRPAFLAWFRRDDGVVMLVTDISAAEKMQTFFYGRKDGTGGEIAADLMKNYVGKMSAYPAFGAGN